MSIEQAIQQRWRSWAPLVALVPTERFATGWLPPTAAGFAPQGVPLVVLERGAQMSATRLSDGREILVLNIRFQIQSPSLEAGQELAAEIHRRFERQEFRGGAVAVQDMKRSVAQYQARGDGSWNVLLEYVTRVEQEG